MASAASAGATSASWILLRLPLEVAPLFRDWLARHRPDAAAHVMNRLRDMRGGKDYDASFGRRMRGQGPFADLIARRFAVAARRLGLESRRAALDVGRFAAPPSPGDQLSLF